MLGLLVFEEAHTLRGFDTLVQAIIATVLLSVFAHGITAAPLSNRFGRQAAAWPPDAPEWGKVVEMPTRGGWGPRARRKPAQRGMEGRLSGR